jgi:hypothetical protein
MPTYLKHTLKALYHEHGLLTFLLFFVPLIPGFIEHQTISYLKLVTLLTGTAKDADPAIKTVFGQRGLKTLSDFRQLNLKVAPITSTPIINAFLTDHNPDQGFVLLNQLFFNTNQRQFIHSDKYRTKVINLLSEIMLLYPGPDNQLVRSLFIQKVATLAHREQAIDPKLAIINQFTAILKQTTVIERQIAEARAKTEMNVLAARIKAELVGTATAGDPQFSFFTESPIPVVPLVTETDVDLMVKTLEFLKQAAAPEIALSAHLNLRHLNQLALN